MKGPPPYSICFVCGATGEGKAPCPHCGLKGGDKMPDEKGLTAIADRPRQGARR